MNAKRVPFEAPKGRSRVSFGGFRRSCEDARAEARGALLSHQYPETPFGEEFKFSFQISRPEVLTKLIFIDFNLADREVEVPRSCLDFLNR